MTSEAALKRNHRKERIGIVVSDKMQKTIVVQIKRKALHPEYGKVIEKANKFKAHDEKSEAKVGDTVRIVETRPLSKDKRWRLVEIVSRAKLGAAVELKEVEAVSRPVEPKPQAPATEKRES